ncbi:Uncharacterized protein HZ326_1996 [Fusarium oxysporum f. sp. albedinis]|nr:Uncharacterized protein HZ326_1996 [Fusarium oxysporum f. sp. albedinis]
MPMHRRLLLHSDVRSEIRAESLMEVVSNIELGVNTGEDSPVNTPQVLLHLGEDAYQTIAEMQHSLVYEVPMPSR